MRQIYRFIESLSPLYTVVFLCQLLGVSTSAYYAYIKGSTYVLSPSKRKVSKRVKKIFERHERRYGARRIQSDLGDEGLKVGRYQIRQFMIAQGLVAIQPKSFVPKTTQSLPNARRSPNLLLDSANLPTAPNQVIVGDITYLPNKEQGESKWLYLAIWLDLFSRHVVGWKVDRNMETALVTGALKQVIKKRQVSQGLIIHTDGGTQYGSDAFRELINIHQFRQSMTRKDNHYDNATAESLFSRFKAELLDGGTFFGLQDAYDRTFEFIDGYYNTIRKHSSIGYLSPMQFEQRFWQQNDL